MNLHLSNEKLIQKALKSMQTSTHGLVKLNIHSTVVFRLIVRAMLRVTYTVPFRPIVHDFWKKLDRDGR